MKNFRFLWKGTSDQQNLNEFFLYEKNKNSNIEKIITKSNQGSFKVTVVTPTTGKISLKNAIDSVLKQNYTSTLHLIVVDGECYEKEAKKSIHQHITERVKVIVLPYNTGKNGFNGHRIYAALAYLLNSDYVFFLDEDNWFDECHVSSLVDLIEKENLDWAYSMRKIYDHQNIFITNDNCESVGNFRPYSGLPSLVDTNCYAIRRQTLTKAAHHWYHPLGADRYFFYMISKFHPNFKSTCQYTVNYKLTENRVPTADFFIKGNKYMLDKYGNKLPWLIK